MPIYEYTCDDCENDINVKNKVPNPPEYVSCNKCEKNMRRVYSSPGIRLTGGGWSIKTRI